MHHPAPADVEADVPITGEDQHVAGPEPRPANATTDAGERVRAVRDLDA